MNGRLFQIWKLDIIQIEKNAHHFSKWWAKNGGQNEWWAPIFLDIPRPKSLSKLKIDSTLQKYDVVKS